MQPWRPIAKAPQADDVLLIDKQGKMFVGWRHSAGYFFDHRSDRLTEQPTHWMPLPDPPNADE